MYCYKCGKENRENSKFCHFCGILLKKEFFSFIEKQNIIKNFKIKWKSPIILILISVILVGVLVYGGIKTYAYYKVESKISTAEKLQKNKDYSGSLNILNELNLDSSTDNQKIKINKLKEDNKNFSDYKTLFDSNVIKINSSATIDDLKLVQTNLQSIDSIYPDYESVRNKLSELNILLLTTLENDSATNKALAEKNKKDAVSAQAAKNKAEQDAKLSADNARGEEVLKSFFNQLLTIRNNFSTLGVQEYINYMEAFNDGDYGLAKVYGGGVVSVCYSTQTNSKELRNIFTNLPTEYNNASINLEWAGYYLCEAISKWISGDISLSKQNSANMFNYYEKVDSFLGL
jgi:hypothetical protein